MDDGIGLSGVSARAAGLDGCGVCDSVDPAAAGRYAEELGLARPSMLCESSLSVRAFLAGDGVAKSYVMVAGLFAMTSISSLPWCVGVRLLVKARSAGRSEGGVSGRPPKR